MEFMLLFTVPSDAPAPEPGRMAQMKQFSAELASQGILRRGAPLERSADGATLRVRDAKAIVSDGPFAESKEVIGGFFIIDVPSRDAALEIAGRCPHARHGTVEMHRMRFRGEFGDKEVGRPFLLVFRMEPGSSDDADARGQEMRVFGEELARAHTMFETGRLADQEPSARIQVRGGKALLTDGPFAESKEAIGGYALVRVVGRAQAIELAQRFPHARWGPIEVREILFLDPV